MEYCRGEFKANQAQTDAITHPPAPLMIVAGAGTGKTTTLIHRIVYLIEKHGIEPGSILAITYTEKAAEELKSRIVAEVGSSAEELTVGTFHAFCYSVVKEFGYRPEQQPILIEEGDAIFMLLNRFDELGPLKSKEFAADPVQAVTRSFIPFLNRIRDELVDLKTYSEPESGDDPAEIERAAQTADLIRVANKYREWKHADGLVDYGDMIQQCYELMLDDTVLEKLQQRFQNLIIDEFQDNNFALNEVINHLGGKRQSITVVGDDDQVIFSFRGASAYNIADFRQRYSKHPDYYEINLVENYRSSQPILDTANAVIANNIGRLEKILVNPERTTGNKPHLFQGSTSQQNESLPERVKELLQHGYQLNEMTVLCRTKNQVKEAARQLQQARIPINVFVSEYFELPVIRDLLAWCQVVTNSPQADQGFYRLLTNTLGPGEARTLYQPFSRRDYTSRIDAIRKNSGYKILDGLFDKIDYLRDQTLRLKKTTAELIPLICTRTGLLRPLVNKYEYQDQVALVNAGDFISRALDFNRRHPANNSLLSFTRYMETLRKAGAVAAREPKKSTVPAVLVQTIHKAKGLEYPAVIIPYNQTQRFPLNYRKNKYIDSPPPELLKVKDLHKLDPRERHRQEERRLFYVALTRAQDELLILAPEKRTSPFVKEIPDNLIRTTKMTDKPVNEKKTNYNDLRIEYEQRLTEALAQDQYPLARDLVSALERLTALAKKQAITWTGSNWELELQEKMMALPPLEIPGHLKLSASAIETYDQCPLKYRLAYIDNIPETGDKPQLVFGNIIHQVLEHFHKDTLSTEAELLDLLERFWYSEGFDYESRETSFKERGIEMLKRYHQYNTTNPAKVLHTEYKFNFDLDSCTIRGKIDRIDQLGSGLKVVDYKTGRANEKPEKSLQLAVYCIYLAQQTEKEPKGLPEAASLLYLQEDDPEHSHGFTLDELEGFKAKIGTVVDGIKGKEFGHRKGRHCDWCDFKALLCPEWED